CISNDLLPCTRSARWGSPSGSAADRTPRQHVEIRRRRKLIQMDIPVTATADVLIIENDLPHADLLKSALTRRGVNSGAVSEADDLAAAFTPGNAPGIVVMDLYLGEADAVDILGVL